MQWGPSSEENVACVLASVWTRTARICSDDDNDYDSLHVLRLIFVMIFFILFLASETVLRTPRSTDTHPLQPPTIELRHRSRSPRRSPANAAHVHLASAEDIQPVPSQLPDSNNHLPEDLYPLSVSPAAANGHHAQRPASPCQEEVVPPRVIQLMPSAIMHPLMLSPGRGVAGEFRQGRASTQENGRDGKSLHHHNHHHHNHHHPSHHVLSLAGQQQSHQQEEIRYRNQILMPVSPPEEQGVPIGRIAGKRILILLYCSKLLVN